MRWVKEKNVSDDIKILFYEICQKRNTVIRYIETDKDHIHYMIELEPNVSISKIVSLIKSYTTYHIWKKYSNVKVNTFYASSQLCHICGYRNSNLIAGSWVLC